MTSSEQDGEDSFNTFSGVDSPLHRQASKKIGPYKLLQEIGEGGMGMVWLAEQNEPVRRRVALKVIRPTIGNMQTLARFEAERQALAMMNHPNIAAILDAGVAESGQPFFVMELVQGLPITEYCDKHRLSVHQRLRLLSQVCGAVQHAHNKGIIHRDLKPSNILVCEEEDEPVPKVIDFGLAKAIEHQARLTDKTLFTEVGQVVGTLQYMSPEQADLNLLDIDTRTDIYSLGVIAYELLAGSTPLRRETMQDEPVVKVLERIKDEEPQRPSTRVANSDAALDSIAEVRRVDPRKLAPSIKHELDWIVLKALEKDRVRRYETANNLAADIERYLADEPVTARPPSRTYKFGKFVRKNRAAVATAVSFAVLLAMFVAVLINSNIKTRALAEETRTLAEEAKREAENARRAERVASEESLRNQQLARRMRSGFRVGYEILEGRYAGRSPELLREALLEIESQVEQPIDDSRIDPRIRVFDAMFPIMRVLRLKDDEQFFRNLAQANADLYEIHALLTEAIENDPQLGFAYLARAFVGSEVRAKLRELNKPDSSTDVDQPFLSDPIGFVSSQWDDARSKVLASIDEQWSATQVDSDWQAAVQLMPNSSYAFSGRGNYRFDNGDYERAEVDLRKAFELDSENDFALLGLHALTKATGRYQEAVDLAFRASRVPTSSGEIFFNDRGLDMHHEIAAITSNDLWDRDGSPMDQLYPAAVVRVFGEHVQKLKDDRERLWPIALELVTTYSSPNWDSLTRELRRIDFPEGSKPYQATRRLLLAITLLASGKEKDVDRLCELSFPASAQRWEGEIDRDATARLKSTLNRLPSEKSPSWSRINAVLDRILDPARDPATLREAP